MEFLDSFDQGFWNFLQTKRQPWLDPLVSTASFLSRPAVLAALAAAVAVLFALRRRFADAILVLAACFGALLLSALLSMWIDHPPPDVQVRPLEEPLSSSSFPSRETMIATATYLAVALGLRSWCGPRTARWALPCGIALAGLAALSRALVGSNYPTDVLAGVIGGLAWVMICHIARQQIEPAPEVERRQRTTPGAD